MDPQDANYLTELTQQFEVFLVALQRLEDKVQEGFDRGIDDRLATLDFENAGELDHLSQARLVAAFTSFTAVQGLMAANTRAHWSAMWDVIR